MRNFIIEKLLFLKKKNFSKFFYFWKIEMKETKLLRSY